MEYNFDKINIYLKCHSKQTHYVQEIKTQTPEELKKYKINLSRKKNILTKIKTCKLFELIFHQTF